MTANIVFVLRVFGPGLGRFARVGFLFSRYGLVLRAFQKRIPRKNKRRENPRAGGRTYSRPRPQVKEKEAKKEPKTLILAEKSRIAEWRIANSEQVRNPFATRHSLLAPGGNLDRLR